MKTVFKILFLILFLSATSFTYADNNKQIKQSDFKSVTTSDNSDKAENKDSSDKKEDNSDKVDEKTEQKSGTGESQKVEKALIIKNLNNMLIESYKAKFSKILGDLNYNIKDKKKDEKLKIFSTVLVSIKTKIDLINSDKIQISDNRKEILVAVLKYIKQDVESKIQLLAKEK